MPEIGLVTVFCPPTTTGAGGLVVQTGEARFVVDCRVKPVKLVGQAKMTFAPEGIIVSWVANERLNTVAAPEHTPIRPNEGARVQARRVLNVRTQSAGKPGKPGALQTLREMAGRGMNAPASGLCGACSRFRMRRSRRELLDKLLWRAVRLDPKNDPHPVPLPSDGRGCPHGG